MTQQDNLFRTVAHHPHGVSSPIDKHLYKSKLSHPLDQPFHGNTLATGGAVMIHQANQCLGIIHLSALWRVRQPARREGNPIAGK